MICPSSPDAHGPVAAVEASPLLGVSRTVHFAGVPTCCTLMVTPLVFIIVCSRARYDDIAFAIYPDGHTFIIEIGPGCTACSRWWPAGCLI